MSDAKIVIKNKPKTTCVSVSYLKHMSGKLNFISCIAILKQNFFTLNETKNLLTDYICW